MRRLVSTLVGHMECTHEGEQNSGKFLLSVIGLVVKDMSEITSSPMSVITIQYVEGVIASAIFWHHHAERKSSKVSPVKPTSV